MKINSTISIFIAATFGWLMTLVGVNWFEDYGLALFILLPFSMGFISTYLCGVNKSKNIANAITVSVGAVGVYALGLFLFAMEGVICLIMAFPIGVALSCVGGIFAYFVLAYFNKFDKTTLFLIMISVPLLMSFENAKPHKASIFKVQSSIIINSNIDLVWENVVTFSKLPEPGELLFKAGIAYPTDATIVGRGDTAIRYCNFSTGPFVEPITRWEEPHHLEFDVIETPAPMNELHFKKVEPPHLHGYFESQNGGFELVELANGRTKLIGTTYYKNTIYPEFYWKLWSNYIIHKIHLRVLKHIKIESEGVSQS